MKNVKIMSLTKPRKHRGRNSQKEDWKRRRGDTLPTVENTTRQVQAVRALRQCIRNRTEFSSYVLKGFWLTNEAGTRVYCVIHERLNDPLLIWENGHWYGVAYWSDHPMMMDITPDNTQQMSYNDLLVLAEYGIAGVAVGMVHERWDAALTEHKVLRHYEDEWEKRYG